MQFKELNSQEMMDITGGGIEEFAANIIDSAADATVKVGTFVYEVGQGVGEACHTFFGCPACW